MLRGVVMFILTLVWAAILVLVGSDFWVKPFFGMFDLANKTVDETGGVFEPASLIAFIVYLLAGMLIFSILSSAAGWLPGRRHDTHHAA
jgi:hypothetical protein